MATKGHKTAELPTGTQRGFTWFKVVGENKMTFLVIFAPGTEIPDEIDFGYQYQSNRGFHPFDKSVTGYDRCVRHHSSYENMDLDSWLDSLIPRPEGCDIKAWIDTYGGCIRLSARTWKNGRVQRVDKKTDGMVDPIPQIADIYGYFSRNCPAPTEEQANAVSISTVGQAIIDSGKKQAIDLFRKWHQTNEEREDEKYGYPSLVVDGLLLNATGISKITFERKAGLRQLLLKIDLDGGHAYHEDEKGATLTLMVPPNETVLKGAKGRKLSDIIGIPGAEDCVIRTARADQDETSPGKFSRQRMVFRSALANQSMAIPSPEEDPIEEVLEDLAGLIGPEGHFTNADASVACHLEAMEPRSLREVLALLKAGESVYLGEYGMPDIRVRPAGTYLHHDHSIGVELKAYEATP